MSERPVASRPPHGHDERMNDRAVCVISIPDVAAVLGVAPSAVASTMRRGGHRAHRGYSVEAVEQVRREREKIMTPAKAAEIRRRRAAKAKVVDLAREYGKAPNTISRICLGQTWRDTGNGADPTT